MASTALDFLVSKLSETLFNIAREELARQMGLVDDVKTLQGTLDELQGYLQDAERKSVEDASTNRWLHQIKDVMYDIEDVLDEYVVEVDEIISGDKSSNESIKPGFFSKALSKFKKASPKRRISIEIQDINARLKNIMEQVPRLELVRKIYSSSSSDSIMANQLSAAHTTYPIVVSSDIVGRRVHDHGRRLVELLMKEDDRDNPLVYAIVGIGGIGKTTLAKLVFEDSIIKSHFDGKVWTSIYQNSNESDILRSIVESISGKEQRGQNLSLLCEKLKDMVNGKRLFMVLDDVWEVENVWNGFLKSLLKGGAARGSRVLVTTRNSEVAEKMMAVYSHSVELLPDEDGWLLLRKTAFPAWEQREAGGDAWGLKDIGIEFVKKCNGLPLAINAVGGILSAESRTRAAWASVLENSLWEVKGLPADIHTALYMSFQFLPAHVKQCFLYFSLLPKGILFTSTTASEEWMQEGFIKEENNLSAYDVGKSYLRLLVRRNLIVSVPMAIEEFGYAMHDLVRALAQFLVQNESRLVANEEEALKIRSGSKQMKLRRLSYIGGGGTKMETLPRCLEEQVSLRTLLVFDQFISKIDNNLFNHLHRLRLLSLHGTSIAELPASVGALTLLRYLNLSSTLIKELPTTIGNLKNLRTLNVVGCINLLDLPACIVNLQHLHGLGAHESALINIPPGLGRLHELQILDFISSVEQAGRVFSSLEELDGLKKLRILSLDRLERALDPLKARSADIKGKHQLETLQLTCSKSDFNLHLYSLKAEQLADTLEKVFEELRPPLELKKLYIIDYFGRKFPTWLTSSPFILPHENVRYIRLMGCSNCKELPSLGLLPNLEELEIGWASSVKYIDPQFYTGDRNYNGSAKEGPFFPRLKQLHITNMDILEKWTNPGEGILAMPCIETFLIRNCPNLKSLPEELLCHGTYLKKVIIEGAEKLSLKAVHDDPSLEMLVVYCINHLESISGLPSLQMLSAVGSLGLNVVDVIQPLDKLIWEDINAETLPGWLSNGGDGAGNLKATSLEIRCNERLLKKICAREAEPGEQEFSKIQHYDNISIWDRFGSLRLSYTKSPYKLTVHTPNRGGK